MPKGLTVGALVRLRFADAVITAWTGDAEPDHDGVPGAQVSDLAWDGLTGFSLWLLSTGVQFSATAVSLELPK